MYNAHFGFREKPFTVTPDPRFFFGSPVYREAYASLVLGIQERKGFVVMTGEVGTGKTLLLRMLMNNLEATVRFVFFYNTTLTFEEVLSFTCEELGLPVAGRGRLGQIQALNRFLVEQLSRGGTAALLIDEAQHLSVEVLENLRLLSNLETGSEKLLQIVLVGQPELQQKLARPELRALKQRVSVHGRLTHLTAPEVAAYVEHRLRTVGYQGRDLFAPSALKCIAQSTNGIPRLVNNICDNALTIAYATDRRKISADIIHEVVRGLQLDLPAKAIAADDERTAPRSVAATSVGQPHQPKGQRAWVRADDLPAPLTASVSPTLAAADELPAPLTASVSPTLAATDWPEDREPDRLWVWILVILCLFAIVGAGLYAIHAGMLPIAPRVAGPARPDAANPPETRPTDAEHPDPNGGQNQREQNSPSLSRPEATAVPTQALVVEGGATAIAIAQKTYDASFVLGLSLMKQFNPHVENLNRVLAGQELRLPPLTRETLLRRAPDGSQSLLLTALFTMPAAERLAWAVHAAGYEVVITPQWISDDLALHRVEIVALESGAQVDRAWDTALANRWIAYAEDGTGRKDQWATRTTP